MRYVCDDVKLVANKSSYALQSLAAKTKNPEFASSIISSLLHLLPPKPSIAQTKQSHARLIVTGLASYASVSGRILALLVTSTETPLQYALSVYRTNKNPNVFASNNLIRCLAKSESPLESVVLYSALLRGSVVRKNNYTFTFVLQGCAKGSGLCEGGQVHCHVVKFGFLEDVFVRNALIHFYCSCFRLGIARELFDESRDRCDVVTWNSMLAGFGKDRQINVVEEMFDQMPIRDVISWNTMIMAYLHSGMIEDAFKCFERMRRGDLMPNEATLVMMVSAAAQLGLLERGRWVHRIIDSLGFPITVTLCTALVDMYGKCGCIEKSKLLFDRMAHKDISTWNAMICGLASHGLGTEALALFDRFLNAGLCPVNVTMVGVLNACSRVGLVTEGKCYFSSMKLKYGVEPEMEHYGCMVDLLGRAGLVSEAIEMVENMTFSPTPVLWATLLCACRMHGLVELGEKVGIKLIELEPNYEGHYVQLASIYAKSRKWEAVRRVRRLMIDRNTGKLTGWSLIEAEGRVHRFVAGDREHQYSQEIQRMLEEMERRLAEAGYNPSVSSVPHDIAEEEKQNAIKVHSERLAIAFGFLATKPGDRILIVKNLRVCDDCHEVSKLISKVFEREIVVRDGSRFHHFKDGNCSCRDYW